MKKVVVYGNTIISEMLFYDALGSENFDIVSFTVDPEYHTQDIFLGLPLVSFDAITEKNPPAEYDMIAVLSGYSNMRDREKMYWKAKSQGYAMRNYISDKADAGPKITMGDNNIILGQTHIGIAGTMGSNNLIRQNTYLGHDFRLGNNNIISPGCSIGGKCQLGNTCFIGIGATIIDNTNIAEETLVGAASLILRDTEPYSKNVGNPSRIVGYHKDYGIRLNANASSQRKK